MKISIASDHGGYELKQLVIKYLTKEGHELIDCGTNSLESCHYPQFAFKAAELVRDNKVEKGIVICTTGEGISISANKVKGVRCALVYNEAVAELCRAHNNANMIALGAKYITPEQAYSFIDIFLKTEFLGDRHLTRVNMIEEYEEKHFK